MFERSEFFSSLQNVMKQREPAFAGGKAGKEFGCISLLRFFGHTKK